MTAAEQASQELVDTTSLSLEDQKNPFPAHHRPTKMGTEFSNCEGFLDRTVLNLNEAFTSLQTWTASSCHEQEEEKRADDEDPTLTGPSILRVFTACTPGVSPLSSVKQFMHNAVDNVDRAVDRAVDASLERDMAAAAAAVTQAEAQAEAEAKEEVVEAASHNEEPPKPSSSSSSSDTSDEHDQHVESAMYAVADSQDEDFDEELQMRRLASWATNGTFGTISTQQSALTLGSEGFGQSTVDDFGNPIDPRLLEKTIEVSQKRTTSRRKRLVKFDYPPVSSLRQCPRADREDLPQMFFSEMELDQLEDDRISTFVADDVEIVAVASSLSDVEVPQQDSPSFPPPPSCQDEQLGSSYVPTPRRKNSAHHHHHEQQHQQHQQHQHIGFSDGTTTEPSNKKVVRRTPTPGPRRRLEAAEESMATTTARSQDYVKDKRLIKSVQIYLRERSTVCANRY